MKDQCVPYTALIAKFEPDLYIFIFILILTNERIFMKFTIPKLYDGLKIL